MVPQQQRRRRRRAALVRTTERRVVIGRGPGGFGFTIAGQRPCVVSAVATGGPADRAGLRAGDALLAVDGASVARAPHASVARLVAAAPGAIALSVAPRESPPTDTEDTEPDERARTRRRHPPPRRRPQAMLHHPGCHAAPSTSGVNEILQNLSRAQLTPIHAARLECRAVVGYLGTIETPQAASTSAPSNVRSAVRKLRQERRPATPVLLSVLPNLLLLRRPTSQVLAQYQRERILYAGCGSESDRRFFGLVTSAETPEAEASHSCHIFAVDPRIAEHEAHAVRAREFQIACTRDPVAERCLEFPPSAEYVVAVIRGMYSLPPDDCTSPALQQISKLAIKGDSPALGNFSRANRPVFRVARDRRPCGHEDGQDFVANSPQPSNHSEITTTSSNSDSGIGFHNDCRNIADRILVVDFVGQQPPPNRFRQETPRRPMGLVGCSSFDAESNFLSNTTPVVDGFGGQGRPLNLDDIMLNANDLQPVRHVSPRNEDDNYNYNNVYGNFPSTSRSYKGVVYDQVYTENEGHYYELLPSQDMDLEMGRVTSTFNSVEIYEERSRNPDCHSNESVENVTVVSGGTSKASMDSVSVYSSRSHEEASLSRSKHLQASLDDMLVLGMRDHDPTPKNKDDGTFLHPASVKFKVRKSMKPLNILSRTRHMLTGKDKKEERRRAISASAGDVTGAGGQDPLPAAASEPDLRDTRDTQSEQSSPFRRWTTGSGAGSSYRHTDHRTLYSKQMSEGSAPETSSSAGGVARGQWANGGVARWSLGLEQLLADPVGRAAFAEFLAREYALENIKFWCSCEEYNQEQDPEQRAKLAKTIWERHLADDASEPVNVDASARRAAITRRTEDPLPLDLFHQAQRQIFHIMRMDSYQRFLRSGEHAECARADLRGLPPPPPYALAAAAAGRASTPGPAPAPSRASTPPPEQHSQSNFGSALSTPSKIQKSSSNASERRRSGGPSLLPWKLRVPSRERVAAAPAATAPAATAPAAADAARPSPCLSSAYSQEHFVAAAGGTLATHARVPSLATAGSQLTDVVKSGPLCRVVLPDGATSVVGVEPGVPVRRLVDRLLQRRNLLAYSYDVLYRDVPEGQPGSIDGNAPSSVLGGREIMVERRCVVRMEVGGRVVAVRCRPARRLRHVLRPVLARYSRANAAAAVAAAAPQVLRDGLPLHPDTTMLELDGARLQIVDHTEGDPMETVQPRSPAAREEDTDSLSEMALRCHDDGGYRLDELCFQHAYSESSGDDGRRGGTAGVPAGEASRPPTLPTVPGVAVPGSACTISGAPNGASGGTSAACGGAAGAHVAALVSSMAPLALSAPGAVVPAASSGRVRAALRPGPPLHNHPPNFLENLRETQRQRLQNQTKNEAIAPRAPAPPPLPPKPSSRTPTLV